MSSKSVYHDTDRNALHTRRLHTFNKWLWLDVRPLSSTARWYCYMCNISVHYVYYVGKKCVCVYACIQTGRQSWWMLDRGRGICWDRLIKNRKKERREIKEQGGDREEGRKYWRQQRQRACDERKEGSERWMGS